MSLLIGGIILSIVLIVLANVAIYGYRRKRGGKALLHVFSVGGFVGMAILLFGCFTEIEANQVGIIYDELNNGIQDQTYGEGLHKKSIFEHIIQIPTSTRTAALTTTGQTNDGQYATFEVSIIYKVNSVDAGKFYRETNATDISSEALNTQVKACLQSSTINYDIFELLSTNLETARLDFMDDLKESLYSTYYITLVNVSFDDIDGGAEVEAILQQKAEALQKIQVAELDAQASIITATNQAEIEKTLADAAAYATRVQGTANGEAASAYVTKIQGMIDSLYESSNGVMTYKECSDIVLSIIFYDTWDGKLPEVLTSDSLSGLIGGLITGTGESEVTGE